MPVGVGDLHERCIDNADVIGAGAAASISATQLGGQNSPVLSRNASIG
ncbi:MAG: hypothetical protein ACREQ5_10315 [Candidatus Dormibacteria bacterium]